MSKLRTGAAVKMVNQRHLREGEITTHPFKWVFERKRQPEAKTKTKAPQRLGEVPEGIKNGQVDLQKSRMKWHTLWHTLFLVAFSRLAA